MPYDETVKELLQATHARLLGYLAGSAVRRWCNIELPTTQMRRVDLLAELENGRLFHLELQTRNDPNIGRRLLEYRLMIENQTKMTPLHMVLYLGWEPMRMSGVWESEGLCFLFRASDIRSLDPAPLLDSPSIEDRILLLLFGQVDARRQARECLQEISRMPHPERGNALAKLLITSGLRRLHTELREEIRHMPLLDHFLEDNPFIQDLFKEGKVEGQQEAVQETVIAILAHRFGPLSEAAKAKILATPTAQLKNALTRVLDAPTLDQALTF